MWIFFHPNDATINKKGNNRIYCLAGSGDNKHFKSVDEFCTQVRCHLRAATIVLPCATYARFYSILYGELQQCNKLTDLTIETQ